MTRNALLAAAALIAGLAVASAASASNLLANGGFEDFGIGGAGYYNLGQDHAVPANFGWTVSDNIDIVTYGAGYAQTGPAAGGGTQAIDLVGYGNGTSGGVSQTFATVAGQTYKFSFDYAHNPGVGGATANVSVNGDSFQVGSSDPANTWLHYDGSFVATGANTTLAFDNLTGGGNGGLYLDNVAVSGGAVPEPATWALMLTGFGLAGATLRRRQLAVI